MERRRIGVTKRQSRSGSFWIEWHPCRQRDMERTRITMVRQAAAELQGNHRPQRKCTLSAAFVVPRDPSDVQLIIQIKRWPWLANTMASTFAECHHLSTFSNRCAWWALHVPQSLCLFVKHKRSICNGRHCTNLIPRLAHCRWLHKTSLSLL